MPSHLADQQSAYLRSAKDQPVHWYPWEPEAFERARTENKPVLLDIGAVWCHWCHVMDHESYEDPEIAELLNRDWICIKVDRDERPDVDARYQRAVQALTGQGGWPLTAFLTPAGEVFFGGTYFPPDGAYGRPGFATVLKQLVQLFREEPERVSKRAQEITGQLDAVRSESKPGTFSVALLEAAADRMARAFDFRNGGFGSQPKFPHPGACDFTLARWFDTRESWLWEIVERTLSGMARGGVRDHLGGGFHRYSVDARWIVPHFEKMSYDNSELLRAYVHASATARLALGTETERIRAEAVEELYVDVVEGIVTWVTDVMSDPAGGYYASQDADVGEDDDGDYFTWTPDELRVVTDPAEFEALSRYYDVDEAGEMRHDPRKNVLWIRQPREQIATAMGRSEPEIRQLLQSGLAKLQGARRERPTPLVDQTLYTGWNAMMAAAMLEAAALLDRPELEDHALATLDRLFREAHDAGGGMRHSVEGVLGGILEDQVQTANAAIDAYEVTGNPDWLARGLALAEHIWAQYRAADGGLRDTVQRAEELGLLNHEITPLEDSPTPSPNGVAGIVFARLAAHTGVESWRERRDTLLGTFAGGAAELSVFGASLLRALDWALMPAAHVVVVGGVEQTADLRRVARRAYRPRKVITWLTPRTPTVALPAPLRAMVDGTAPQAYVCAGTQCAPPIATPNALAETMATFAITVGSAG